MFNKLKYPARGDLPVRGIEFVEGTGASYGAEGAVKRRDVLKRDFAEVEISHYKQGAECFRCAEEGRPAEA